MDRKTESRRRDTEHIIFEVCRYRVLCLKSVEGYFSASNAKVPVVYILGYGRTISYGNG